jgi:hypothetical protein
MLPIRQSVRCPVDGNRQLTTPLTKRGKPRTSNRAALDAPARGTDTDHDGRIAFVAVTITPRSRGGGTMRDQIDDALEGFAGR